MYFGFENISIAYGPKTVLEEVTISFPKGKVTSIIGPNGCGKSSLLRTISRAITPSSGRILLEEKSLYSYAPKELAKRIALLPQFHPSPQDLDIRTLVSYGRYPYRKWGRGLSKEDEDIIEESMQLVGLQGLADRAVGTLSGGERQRAWIGMSICQKPQILVLDEPITHLDIGFQLEIMELIRSLGRNLKMTIVMVLHDINLAARYSDWIVSLKDKSVASFGTPQEVVSESNMESIFQIGSQIFDDQRNHCPFIIPEQRPI